MCLAAASSAAGRQGSALLMCMQATHVAAGGNVCVADADADYAFVLVMLCLLHVLYAAVICSMCIVQLLLYVACVCACVCVCVYFAVKA